MKNMSQVGSWAFLLGLVIAVLSALVSLDIGVGNLITLLLVIIGIVVGLLNVTDKEVVPFLVATIAFMASVGGLGPLVLALGGASGFVGFFVAKLLSNVAVFVAPAAAIVAIKAIYDISKTV